MQKPYDAITDFLFIEDKMGPADVILVPGGSKPELMEKACELFHQGLAPCILPSGGKNDALRGFETEWRFLRKLRKE